MGQLHTLFVTSASSFVCEVYSMHQKKLLIQCFLVAIYGMSEFGTDGLSASVPVPVGKYWGVFATVCGFYPRIRHSDEPTELVGAVNGLQAGHKFKTFESFRFAFIESFWGGCPNYSISILVIPDFFCTSSSTNDILSEGFSISFTE